MSIQFFRTNISKEAIEYSNSVIKSTHISAGKVAEAFEKKLISELNVVNPVTLNSATSALHLALVVAGIKKGDEVIIPAQTFIATGLVVLMQGATPVFADIQLETGNIDPLSIKEKITSKTKAIIPVHWSGYPCDMDEINQIAKENNLIVIEDAAHAIGAKYKGKAIGSISNFTAFSFQAIKHLTTGDGGALCCLNSNDFYQAKRRRWFDIDRDNAKPSILGERVYDAEEIGYKYHMNDIAAAMGIGNLKTLPEILNHHKTIATIYSNGLKNIPGIELMKYKNDRESSWWFYQIKLENREDFIKKLNSKGIPSSVVHLRIDKNSVLGGLRNELVNQNEFNAKQVSLPIHMGLSEEITQSFIEEIKKGW
jgi:perosamine synthetase